MENRKTLAEMFEAEMGDIYKAPMHYAEMTARRLKDSLINTLSQKQLQLFNEYENALEKLISIIENESFSRGLFVAKHLK